MKLKVALLSPLTSTIHPIFPASFVLTALPALTGGVIFNKVEATSTALVLLFHHLLTLSHWRKSIYS